MATNKKYKMLKNDTIIYKGVKLYRIQALKSFNDVEKGDLGGYIQSHKNLSHDGNCWVYDNAKVFNEALVEDNAQIHNQAMIYGSALVADNAEIFNNVKIFKLAKVFGDAKIYHNVRIYGSAIICDHATLYDYAEVFNNATVYNNATIADHAKIYNDVKVRHYALVYDNAIISNAADVHGMAVIAHNARIDGNRKYITMDNVGSRNNTVTFYISDNEIFVKTGCFHDTLKEFKKAVKSTHKGSIYEKEYNDCINLAETKLLNN